jgi:hypothetical protein
VQLHERAKMQPVVADAWPAQLPAVRQRACGALLVAAGKLAGMSAWQYAQLTIRLEGRGGENSCTILWHGPGQGLGENFFDSGQTGAGADEQGRC